jgi:hypothetical protein
VRIAATRHTVLAVLLFAFLGPVAACAKADLPEPSGQVATSGGPWATQANVVCTEVAASSARPTGEPGTGVPMLAWHQEVTYLLASRLSTVPDGGSDASSFVSALQEVGRGTEDLVTALKAKPVDDEARQKADVARTAAIGQAAALSSRLGLAACTPLVAGG